VFDPDGPVLGIDPGVSRCGYGVVSRERGGGLVARSCGVIRTDPQLALPDRLVELERELERLVDEEAPSAVAVERVLFQANVRTAMSVGQASGLALLVAARANVPVAQYSPNEVKLAVTGDGAADKAQMQMMVTRLLGLGATPRPPDAADALGLALCHLSGARFHAALPDAAGSTPAPVSKFERAVAAAIAREESS
jgi:crossover junction endodeoxyribonuclease RuvC